jgi:uncharacterized protein (DUF4213/DUF364 family)
MMIKEETYRFLTTKHRSYVQHLTVEEVRIGLHLAAVRLSDKSVGVAGTLKDDSLFCRKRDRDFGTLTPGRIRGTKVVDLLESPKDSGIISTLQIAVLNAISGTLMGKGNYQILRDTDPIDLLDLSPRKTICIVGAFHSYIERISETENELYVLELDENMLSADEKKYFVPARDYAHVVPRSEIVIMTGLTLVNNTIDGLLKACSTRSKRIVTGPSGCLLPDVLFRHRVDIIGGTLITRPEMVFEIVEQGGAAYHLFQYCAEKICILNGS